jgi:hypothetical protein
MIPLFLLLAGFIVGLGAVTVIDIHGFLGRKSKYWTEATTRAHTVTKPLIWLGIFLVILGGGLHFWPMIPVIPSLILGVLILNGCWLTFWVSPHLLKQEKQGKADKILSKKWQAGITLSFLISFAGWWSLVGLLTLHLYTNGLS